MASLQAEDLEALGSRFREMPDRGGGQRLVCCFLPQQQQISCARFQHHFWFASTLCPFPDCSTPQHPPPRMLNAMRGQFS